MPVWAPPPFPSLVTWPLDLRVFLTNTLTLLHSVFSACSWEEGGHSPLEVQARACTPGKIMTCVELTVLMATDQESRLETILWGRNIVLIWGITKPFQQNEVPCYTCKEFRALKANVYFRVAYSLNIEQGTSFSGRVWWYLKSKLCCGPKVTFPI